MNSPNKPPERRLSLARRGQLGHLLRELESLQGISPAEVVLILRAINLTFVRHEADEALLAAVARPLAGCADEIEQWTKLPTEPA